MLDRITGAILSALFLLILGWATGTASVGGEALTGLLEGLVHERETSMGSEGLS